MAIGEFNVPTFRRIPTITEHLQVGTFESDFNALCRRKSRMWPFHTRPVNPHCHHQHRQGSTAMRGKWPTSEQLVLLQDPNAVSKKELYYMRPDQLQAKRMLTKEMELDRLRKELGVKRDKVKRQSEIGNQRTFENWLKCKIKVRKEESLYQLKQLKLDEERKSLFGEYKERKSMEEVGKWLKNKVSVVEDVIDVNNMSAEMRKWYEAQKNSMKATLLAMWGHKYHRNLPSVDRRRFPKYPGIVNKEASVPSVKAGPKAYSSPIFFGERERRVQFSE